LKYDTFTVFSDAYRGEAVKESSVSRGIDGSKGARMSKSQMKKMLITFFDIKRVVHFEFFFPHKANLPTELIMWKY